MLGGNAAGVLAPARRHIPPCAEPTLSRRMSPFMVVGRVNGQEQAARAGSPAEALDHILGWLHEDEDAAAVWYLREDWPEPITLVGRPAAGLIGETRRSAHLFRVEPGVVLYGSVTACCGAGMRLPEIEWLNVGAGMPCVCCLAVAAPDPRRKG
ncbi:MAG TPA: hypothetical protein VHC18_08545 [Amycolatopsis sp.]|nr:hypothetical protein [Amycolatopsis sp.]